MLNVPVPSKLHIRRAVEPGEAITGAEALARFNATRARTVPVARPIAVKWRPHLYEEEFGPKLKATVATKDVWFAPPAEKPAALSDGRDWLHLASRLSCDRVIAATAKYYSVTRSDLASQRRTANVVMPRQVAMYLCRELTGRSLPFIGSRLGGRDHTTILHGVRKISEMLEAGHPLLHADILDIKYMLGKPK